ncbi:MAG: Fic family protein [Myxococcota bacterium]
MPAYVEHLVDQLSIADGDAPTIMVRAAMVHLNLVMIHPFSDGSGRMARALQSLVLSRGGLLDPTFCSIEEYLGHNTQAYYDVLASVGNGRWQPERDARPWVRFCLIAHYRQAKTAQRRLETIASLGAEIERQLEVMRLPQRAAASLVNASLGHRLRRQTYCHEADVSPNIASRELKQLVDMGFLVGHGEKRGRSYEASTDLMSLAKRYRGNRPVEDPFELIA